MKTARALMLFLASLIAGALITATIRGALLSRTHEVTCESER